MIKTLNISSSTAFFPWNTQKSNRDQKTGQKTIAETLPQLADQAVNVSVSKEGLAYYHANLSGGIQPEDMEKLNDEYEFISMKELPCACSSINLGIGLGGTLQEIGQRYAEQYDKIVQNHGKGRRVVVYDDDGKMRDATLEEKLAVLDRSFENALDFSKYCEERRPFLIQMLERKVESYREIGADDLADETIYRLENLKRAQKLPDDFRKNMISIRDLFKKTYYSSSSNEAWENMLNAINQLFKEK